MNKFDPWAIYECSLCGERFLRDAKVQMKEHEDDHVYSGGKMPDWLPKKQTSKNDGFYPKSRKHKWSARRHEATR